MTQFTVDAEDPVSLSLAIAVLSEYLQHILGGARVVDRDTERREHILKIHSLTPPQPPERAPGFERFHRSGVGRRPKLAAPTEIPADWQVRTCEVCGQAMKRNRRRDGKLEAPSQYRNRKTCSEKCRREAQRRAILARHHGRAAPTPKTARKAPPEPEPSSAARAPEAPRARRPLPAPAALEPVRATAAERVTGAMAWRAQDFRASRHRMPGDARRKPRSSVGSAIEVVLRYLSDHRGARHTAHRVSIETGLPYEVALDAAGALADAGVIRRSGAGSKHSPYAFEALTSVTRSDVPAELLA